MTEQKPTDKCVFVIGCDRSGTTLLQSLLNAHPDVLITYEKGFIYPFEDQYNKAGLDGVIELAHKRGLLEGVDNFDRSEIQRCGADISFAHLMAEIYRRQARRQDKHVWGDKRPDYCTNVSRLADLFPNSRFVHIVRDPRAVALSWAKTNWGPMTAYHAAKRWVFRVTEVSNAFEQLDETRIITVNFENLIKDQVNALTQICKHIGVQFDPIMLDPSHRALNILPNRLDRLHPNRSKALQKERVDAWKTTSYRTLYHIEAACCNEMVKWGYSPATKIRVTTPIPIYWEVAYKLLAKFRQYWRRSILKKLASLKD